MNMIKLSVRNPNISVVSGILSVMGIPTVTIPEEIQLFMYARCCRERVSKK